MAIVKMWKQNEDNSTVECDVDERAVDANVAAGWMLGAVGSADRGASEANAKLRELEQRQRDAEARQAQQAAVMTELLAELRASRQAREAAEARAEAAEARSAVPSPVPSSS